MKVIALPRDGRRLQVGDRLEVSHHGLGLDHGLEIGEQLVAACLDDHQWVVEVEAIEFDLADTLYGLRVTWPSHRDPEPPSPHTPVTTLQTAYLLRLLGTATRRADATPRSSR